MSMSTQRLNMWRTVRALIHTSDGLNIIPAGNCDAGRTVRIVLRDSERLTSEELIKIARMAEQAHSAVRISYGSWRVLIDIPEASHPLVTETLRAMGYTYDALSLEIDERSTFVLREGMREREGMKIMKPHFKTIGEIRITNKLSATEDTSAYAVAVKLLSISFQGLPVLDGSGKVVGKVTEMDLLKGLKEGRNLKQVRVKEIMALPPPVISTETTVEEAVEIMDANHLLRLPVISGGRFIGNITRHDLLRAWMGYWVDQDYAQVIG